MTRFLSMILLLISSGVFAADNFGGYGERLEKINVAASYSDTNEKARDELKNIPEEYVLLFSEFAYKRFLKSQSQSDYTGILELITPENLSKIVEKVMLTESFGYDYLDHEFYFSNTPAVSFNNPAAVYANVLKNIKDPCEQSVWNAIFIAKGHKDIHFNTNCKLVDDLVGTKSTFTKNELIDIYYTFRDIDGY